MRWVIRRWGLALLLVLAIVVPIAPPVAAAEIRGLYESQVPVAGKSAQQRVAALGVALSQVIVKVSGQRNPLGHPAVAEALKAPGRFVQQFQYRIVDAPDQSVSPGPSGLRLWARFDPQVVDGLVREAGLPVWGRARPSVLVWAVVERDGRREILGPDEPTGLATIMTASAAGRGIPLVMPLLDLEDRTRIRASDVWAGFVENIKIASARYDSEGILVVRAYPLVASLWEARWELILPDGTQRWESQSDLVEILVEDGTHEAADRLAIQYAAVGAYGDPLEVVMVVSGVNNLADYARALKYLGSLDETGRVDVVRVEADRVWFDLEARGGQDGLRRLVSLGTTLAVESVDGAVLRVKLRP